MNDGENRLVVNLSEVPMIDSSGIAVLVRTLTQAKQHGGALKLVNPSKFALQTLKIVGLLNLFELFPDESQASSRSTKLIKKKRVGTAKPRPLIRCVIFDLDDTLYDCLGQRVRPAHRHAAEAMVGAGLKGSVDDVYHARLRAFHIDPMLHHIDAEVIKHFRADDPEAVSRAAHDAYFNCPVGKLTLFQRNASAASLPEQEGPSNLYHHIRRCRNAARKSGDTRPRP